MSNALSRSQFTAINPSPLRRNPLPFQTIPLCQVSGHNKNLAIVDPTLIYLAPVSIASKARAARPSGQRGMIPAVSRCRLFTGQTGGRKSSGRRPNSSTESQETKTTKPDRDSSFDWKREGSHMSSLTQPLDREASISARVQEDRFKECL